MLTRRQLIQNGGALLTLHAAAPALLRAQPSPLADTQAFVTKAEALKPALRETIQQLLSLFHLVADSSHRSILGAMAADGADSFWEAFNPPFGSQWAHNGDIHIDSFSHAWNCTRAYFLRTLVCWAP